MGRAPDRLTSNWTERDHKDFCLVKGEISAINQYFPEKEFFDWLIETGKIHPPLRLNHNLLGAEKASSVVAILIEQGFIQSDEAFKLMADFLRPDIRIFRAAWLAGGFYWRKICCWRDYFYRVSHPTFNLERVEKVSKLDVYRRWLPAENSLLFRQVPAYVSRLGLTPADLYVWNLLQTPQTFNWLIQNSWLGPTETRKTVLILTCLRLLDFNRQETGEIDNGQIAGPDLEKCLLQFNEKANLIQRYIAKQLGPVAFNLLEKSYRETQDSLDPIFRNLEIKPDGSFEPRAMLKISLNSLDQREKKIILRGFDEILAAELLLVKKTLGNQHEENLVKLLAQER